MIPLIVGILLVILFIVIIVFAASKWRGWHFEAACLTFLSVLGLVIIASLSHKTHVHWKSEHAKVTKMLHDASREARELEYGDPLVLKAPDSLLETQGRLKRALLDRGRVWRQCTPGAPSRPPPRPRHPCVLTRHRSTTPPGNKSATPDPAPQGWAPATCRGDHPVAFRQPDRAWSERCRG